MEFSDYFASVNSSPSQTPFVSAPSSPTETDSLDFDFSARFSDATHPGYGDCASSCSPVPMSSAEELFQNGKIKPLNSSLDFCGPSPQRASCSSCNYSEFLQKGFHQRALCEGIYAQESALEIWKRRRKHSRASSFNCQENASSPVSYTCRDMEIVSQMDAFSRDNAHTENRGSDAGYANNCTHMSCVSVEDSEIYQSDVVSANKGSCSDVGNGEAVDSEVCNRLSSASNGDDGHGHGACSRDESSTSHCCGLKNMLPSSPTSSSSRKYGDLHQKLDAENRTYMRRNCASESFSHGGLSHRLDAESNVYGLFHQRYASENMNQHHCCRRSTIRSVQGNGHRRARSLSPLRVFHMDDHYRPSFEEAVENLAPNRSKRKTLKELLNVGNHRVSELTKAQIFFDSDKFSKPRLSANATQTQQDNNGSISNGYGKLQIKARQIPHHPHHQHYASQRAQEVEVMKRRTFLPYKHGLLGCLGFSSKNYSSSLKGLNLLK